MAARDFYSGAERTLRGTVVNIDFTPVIAKIKAVLSTASVEIQRRATYNALNAVGGPLLTLVRRDVAKQTSIPYGRVMRRIWDIKAHPNNLRYVIRAADTATHLKDFMKGGKAGDKKVVVKVWGKQRTMKKDVFLVDFGRGPTPVKRVAKHMAKGKGRLGAKALYGPIIPKEMLREGFKTRADIVASIPLKLIPRLEHEIAQAFGRAAKAGGTFVGPMRNKGVDRKFFGGYQV